MNANPIVVAFNDATNNKFADFDYTSWITLTYRPQDCLESQAKAFDAAVRLYLGDTLYKTAESQVRIDQMLRFKLGFTSGLNIELLTFMDHVAAFRNSLTPNPKIAQQENVEAADLYRLLTLFYDDVRPEWPGSIYAWAVAALTRKETELIDHVQAARKKIKGRDTYAHTVFGMMHAHLTKHRSWK
jgi:hypothetical protein